MKHILLFATAFCAFLCLARPAGAWTNHMILTYAALKDVPGAQGTVEIEPIEVFLIDEKDRLGPELEKEEAWARKNIREYGPRPDVLAFSPTGPKSLRERFLNALRLNPGMMFALYVQARDPKDPRPRIAWNRICLYSPDYLKRPLVEVHPGQKVSITEVVASGSNEPDDGYDMGLHEDNDTPYGKLYGYGKQPISNPKEFTYSQAGFHMGFYHESWIVFKAAPILKKTCPEQRAHLFFTLSRFAFRTGHPYWGYRFMGMGMHYVADMNMPYHACTLPGVSTLKLLWYSVLKALGFDKSYNEAVDHVTNSHALLETLVYDDIRAPFDAGDFSAPMLASLADTSGDKKAGEYSGRYLTDVVSDDAYDAAPAMARALDRIITDRELFKKTGELNVKGTLDAAAIIAGAKGKDLKRFRDAVNDRMKKQGGYIRAYFGAATKGFDLPPRSERK